MEDDASEAPRIYPTDHAKLRSKQGRPVGQVINDVQRAGRDDAYVQPDGRYVVRGPKGREHVIEPTCEHMTSVNRPHSAHKSKVVSGERRHATDDEYDALKEFVR